MTVRRSCELLLLVLGACTSNKQSVDVVGDSGALPPDAVAMPAMTNVTGALDGVAFTLRHGAVMRAVSGDPRNWVCASDVPTTVAQCQMSGGPARTLFLGAFVYDSGGSPKWDLAETGLARVGAGAITKLALSGTIDVTEDDVPSGPLQLTLHVDFGETPVTSGMLISE